MLFDLGFCQEVTRVSLIFDLRLRLISTTIFHIFLFVCYIQNGIVLFGKSVIEMYGSIPDICICSHI